MNGSDDKQDAAGCDARLRAAVDQAYRVFRRYPAPPWPLDVCLHCCVSASVERELRDWPLARLTAKHMYDYNGSAKSKVQPARELGHLLPRMLELLAAGEEIHHSVELSLDRLGRCPPGSWDAVERQVLERFAVAYFDRILLGAPPGDMARPCVDDPFSILLMFDIGGIDIEPLLTRWLDCEDPFSTLQFVDATYWWFWKDRIYSNAFAGDRPRFRARIHDWILDPRHRERFAGKLLAPEFLAFASRHPGVGCMPFDLVVDGVFDELAADR